MNMNHRSLCLALLLGVSSVGGAQSKAHTHGEATLDIGIEGRRGTLVFRAPAEDLYGFERAPRTSAERTAQLAVLNVLRSQPASLVRFDAALGCSLTAETVGVVEEKGGHGDVQARYTVDCRVPPAGRPMTFAFSKAFPGVRTVKVQLVSDTAQVGTTITNDRGSVRP